MRRLFASLMATAILLAAVAAPAIGAPPGGTSKGINLTAAPLTGLGSFTVSGGQSIPLTITVSNDGKSTVNDVTLTVGQDDNSVTIANGDASVPVALPTGVTVAADGCQGGSLLTCSIGTLRARGSVSFDVVFSTAEVTTALPTIMTKATVVASEGGNDNGSNLDSFGLEGDLTVTAFSCESVTVYKPGADKLVETCGLDDARNGNGQSASVVLPSGLVTATVSEKSAVCPPVSGLTCIGDLVEAVIDGDDRDDIVEWTTSIEVNGAVNLNKLTIYHYNDAGVLVDIIPLSKKNACKSASSTNCGSATLTDGVLEIVVRTPGNGAIRGFG